MEYVIATFSYTLLAYLNFSKPLMLLILKTMPLSSVRQHDEVSVVSFLIKRVRYNLRIADIIMPLSLLCS